MYILGLSFDYHDSAAAIMFEGTLIAAAQEERFTRIKHDASLPKNAIEFCLAKAGIRPIDISQVVHYEDPFAKFARIIWASRQNQSGREYLKRAIESWFSLDKLGVRKRIADHLNIPINRISTMNHHDAHAASTFFCSPFQEATVVTLDGAGEFETGSISIGRANKLTRLKSINLPNSLGLLYSALTAYLGFEVNEGEYKVMGMAGFGEPIYYDILSKMIILNNDGSFFVDQQSFNFLTPHQSPFTHHLIDLLGPSRTPESIFNLSIEHSAFLESKRFADIAASIQKLTEDIIIHVVTRAVAQTGVKNVCLAGGCALNSIANQRLAREYGFKIYIQPSAGDAGSALGAALYGAHVLNGFKRGEGLKNIYLGSEFDDNSIDRAIRSAGLKPITVFDSDFQLTQNIAQLLANGSVIGWFQGRSEWGPRALGARSILADPTHPDMKAKVNEKIKFREVFRPFAPSVLLEDASIYFDLPNEISPTCPENFMLKVCTVHNNMQKRLPAITHVDGTARVQTVRRDINPLYYDLIANMKKLNGIPMLLNTSFNLRGEPIVDSPTDAIKTFSWSDMDYLVMGSYLLKKEWP